MTEDQTAGFTLPNPAENPPRMAITGSSGVGKSGFLQRVAEHYHDMSGVTPVMLYSSKRMEHGYCLLPGELEPWTEDACSVNPTAHDARILKAYAPDLNRRQPAPVQPFTLPVTALDKTALQAAVGEMSTGMETIINQLIRETDRSTTLPELISMTRTLPEQTYVETDAGMKVKSPSRRGVRQIQHRLASFLDTRIISSAECDLALTQDRLAQLLAEEERLVFETAHLESVQLRVFVVAQIVAMIDQLMQDGTIDTYPVLFVSEARDLLPDDAGDERRQALAGMLERSLREGRGRGIGWVLDSQLPGDLADNARANIDYLATGRLPSASGLETVLSDRASSHLSREDKDRIKEMPDFVFTVFTPTGVLEGQQVLPPRHRIAEPGDTWQELFDQHIGEYRDWSNAFAALEQEIESAIEAANQQLEAEEDDDDSEAEQISELEKVPAALLRQAMDDGITTTDVEEELGISSSSARKRLRTWREHGIMDKSREGNAVVYRVAQR